MARQAAEGGVQATDNFNTVATEAKILTTYGRQVLDMANNMLHDSGRYVQAILIVVLVALVCLLMVVGVRTTFALFADIDDFRSQHIASDSLSSKRLFLLKDDSGSDLIECRTSVKTWSVLVEGLRGCLGRDLPEEICKVAKVRAVASNDGANGHYCPKRRGWTALKKGYRDPAKAFAPQQGQPRTVWCAELVPCKK